MKLIRVDIHAQNPVRAMDFYHDVFGWDFEKFESMNVYTYWSIRNGPPGIQCGIIKRDGETMGAPNAYVCTFEVESVDAVSARITAEGGRIMAPKIAMPGMGWLVICQDTEGNMFSIQENDKSAHETNPLFKT